MTMAKATEAFKGKSVEELQGAVADLKKELFNLRFQKASGELTNHLFRHDDRNVLLAVVNAKGKANELRQNGAAARPDSNHRVAVALVGLLGFLEQIPVDERTFPN
jgi:ribosomal protein L29